MKTCNHIVKIVYCYEKRSVTVHYVSGAVRTYRGRIPFPVAEYIGELNYNAGYRKGYKVCKNHMEGGSYNG